MPADPGGGEAQPLGQLGRGRRTVLEDGAGHPLAGGGVGVAAQRRARRDRGPLVRGFSQHQCALIRLAHSNKGRLTLRSRRRMMSSANFSFVMVVRAVTRTLRPTEGASRMPQYAALDLRRRRRLVRARVRRRHDRVRPFRGEARRRHSWRSRPVPDQHGHGGPGRGARGGEVVTSDGPYAETKEAFTGFYLLEAADLDAAIALAAEIPARGTVRSRCGRSSRRWGEVAAPDDRLAEVVRTEGARILATLVRTTGNWSVAEDAVQEAVHRRPPGLAAHRDPGRSARLAGGCGPAQGDRHAAPGETSVAARNGKGWIGWTC